jgi:hypothetical protein
MSEYTEHDGGNPSGRWVWNNAYKIWGLFILAGAAIGYLIGGRECAGPGAACGLMLFMLPGFQLLCFFFEAVPPYCNCSTGCKWSRPE